MMLLKKHSPEVLEICEENLDEKHLDEKHLDEKYLDEKPILPAKKLVPDSAKDL